MALMGRNVDELQFDRLVGWNPPPRWAKRSCWVCEVDTLGVAALMGRNVDELQFDRLGGWNPPPR